MKGERGDRLVIDDPHEVIVQPNPFTTPERVAIIAGTSVGAVARALAAHGIVTLNRQSGGQVIDALTEAPSDWPLSVHEAPTATFRAWVPVRDDRVRHPLDDIRVEFDQVYPPPSLGRFNCRGDYVYPGQRAAEPVPIVQGPPDPPSKRRRRRLRGRGA